MHFVFVVILKFFEKTWTHAMVRKRPSDLKIENVL